MNMLYAIRRIFWATENCVTPVVPTPELNVTDEPKTRIEKMNHVLNRAAADAPARIAHGIARRPRISS